MMVVATVLYMFLHIVNVVIHLTLKLFSHMCIIVSLFNLQFQFLRLWIDELKWNTLKFYRCFSNKNVCLNMPLWIVFGGFNIDMDIHCLKKAHYYLFFLANSLYSYVLMSFLQIASQVDQFLVSHGGRRPPQQTLSRAVVVDIAFGHRLDTWRTSIKGSANRWQWCSEAVTEGHFTVQALCHPSYRLARESVESIHNTEGDNRSALWGLATGTWQRAWDETYLNPGGRLWWVNLCLLVLRENMSMLCH